MEIAEIMSRTVVTVEPDDRLATVKDIFDQASFHHLLVVEDGLLQGVLSDRDLLKSISPNIGTNRYTVKDLQTLEKPVHQVMTRHPVVLGERASVIDAIETFNKHAISCIPIVDSEGHIRGIVTWRDIMKNFSKIARLACPPG